MTRPLARSFFYYWYNTALRDYVAASHAGEYRPLLQVLKITLSRALLCFSEEIEIIATEAETQTIMLAFNEMEPPSQVSEALDLLLQAEEQWDIWVLSNGDYEGAKQLLSRTKLAAYIGDNILCCDDLGISKPHPKVYSELMRMAVHRTKRIENFYMVGSHAFELAGAKNVALRTVFLNTIEKVYASQLYRTGDPDITGHSLVDCVTKLIEFEREKKHFVQPILTNDAAITIENM